MPMQLYRRFYRRWLDGRTDTGNHRRVVAVKTPDASYLLGYGHAKYARRDLDTGEVTLFTGWASDATNASGLHVGTLRQEAYSHLDDSLVTEVPTMAKVDGTAYSRFDVEETGSGRVGADIQDTVRWVPPSERGLADLFGGQASLSAD